MSKRLAGEAFKYSALQSKFYDNNPPLAPWPDILIERGLSLLYKPREIFWKKELDKLGFKSSDNLLEIGCGQGVFLKRIVRTYGVNGAGVDVSEKSIEYACRGSKVKNANFVIGDVLNLPFQKETFSVVISFDLLEHVDNQDKALTEMMRVLKPGGQLVIYSLNKRYKYTLDWIWEVMGFDIYSRAAHKKELLIDTKKLKQYLQRGGMKITDCRLFDAFFTLALDELIMAKAYVLGKLGLFKKPTIGRLFLGLCSLISRLFYPTLNLLDILWLKKNYSLSFIIVCKKYAI